ncbi:MAG: hypothetical protein AB1295_05085 [Candidatus Micrarchaeota archaeon]
MERMEEIQDKVDSLLEYRQALEGSDRELFDMLICFANEVAMAVDRKNIRGC